MRNIGNLLHADEVGRQAMRGAALVVDYGGDHAFGNSFRVRVLHIHKGFVSAEYSKYRRSKSTK